jgi:HEAT repeat protein
VKPLKNLWSMPRENKPGKARLDNRILMDLWSEDEKTTLKAIRELRSKGSIHYIPELLKLLNKTTSETVEKELVRFLSDVKDTAAIPFILDGLRDRDLAGARGNIVSACWQSGLDFSRDVELFIQLFLEGDYHTALESFTVIEESVINMSGEKIEHARDLLMRELDRVNEEKGALARELVKLLQV